MQVAVYMLTQSTTTNPVLVGSSVNNVEIECLWRDTFRCVLSVFYQLFHILEETVKLDPSKLNSLTTSSSAGSTSTPPVLHLLSILFYHPAALPGLHLLSLPFDPRTTPQSNHLPHQLSLLLILPEGQLCSQLPRFLPSAQPSSLSSFPLCTSSSSYLFPSPSPTSSLPFSSSSTTPYLLPQPHPLPHPPFQSPVSINQLSHLSWQFPVNYYLLQRT